MELANKLLKRAFVAFVVISLSIIIFKSVYPIRFEINELPQKRIAMDKLPADVAEVMKLSITKQEESLKKIKGYKEFQFDDLINLDHEEYKVEYSANYGGPFTKPNWFDVKHYRFRIPINNLGIDGPFVFKDRKLYCRYNKDIWDNGNDVYKFVEIDFSEKI